MPESILNTKINEALVATGHDRHDAQKLLLTWAVRDPALLLAMTKPHLKAIAAGHIDHFMRKPSGKGSSGADEDRISRAALGDIVPTDRRQRSAVPPPKSTERQASAMRRLAEAFRKKK